MSFSAVDLSKLPAPDIVETLDYEVILAQRLARLEALLKDPDNPILPDWDKDLKSDTIVKVVEESAYRELLHRQKVNDGARAVMLALSGGSNLDQLLANFNTARLEVSPAQPDAVPPVARVMEGDESFKARGQMAWEALSTAGPDGAYIYHAKSASARVFDVDVDSPEPGLVVVTIITSDGDGTADAELIALVSAALPGAGDGVRPFTDAVLVQSGVKIDYTVDALLELYDGPDQEVVRAAAAASLAAFVTAQRRLGEPVTIDGFHKALRVEGVRRVTLAAPLASIEVGRTAFANCTALTVTIASGGA